MVYQPTLKVSLASYTNLIFSNIISEKSNKNLRFFYVIYPKFDIFYLVISYVLLMGLWYLLSCDEYKIKSKGIWIK